MSVPQTGPMERLRTYCFPAGEDAARGELGIKTAQRGEIRSDPAAKWILFTAEEFVDAVNTGFRWEARMGSGLVTSVGVTESYENGHGRLVLRKRGSRSTALTAARTRFKAASGAPAGARESAYRPACEW